MVVCPSLEAVATLNPSVVFMFCPVELLSRFKESGQIHRDLNCWRMEENQALFPDSGFAGADP